MYTYAHRFLHYDSCHADHIKRYTTFSRKLRLKRTCSEENALNGQVKDMKKWFCQRRYSENLVEEQVERVLWLTLREKSNSSRVNNIPLVVTYNPALKNLSQMFRKIHKFLYADEQVKKVFSSP